MTHCTYAHIHIHGTDKFSIHTRTDHTAGATYFTVASTVIIYLYHVWRVATRSEQSDPCNMPATGQPRTSYHHPRTPWTPPPLPRRAGTVLSGIVSSLTFVEQYALYLAILVTPESATPPDIHWTLQAFPCSSTDFLDGLEN